MVGTDPLFHRPLPALRNVSWLLIRCLLWADTDPTLAQRKVWFPVETCRSRIVVISPVRDKAVCGSTGTSSRLRWRRLSRSQCSGHTKILTFAWPSAIPDFKRLSYAKDTCDKYREVPMSRAWQLSDTPASARTGRRSTRRSQRSRRRERRGFIARRQAAKAERKELARALKAITAGDTLLVTWLDRLARSTRDLVNIVDTISRAGAGFRSLADAWADTTTPHGRLMLTVLGGLAEFERELIRARTGEGRKRARARGVHMGRPPKLTKHQRREALTALADGSATQADLARRFNVSQTTISRLARP